MPSELTIFKERPAELATGGTVLLRRAGVTDSVIYIVQGRVLLGIAASGVESDAMEHQLGVVEGPGWLDATAAILKLPAAVDAVAQTPVQFHRLSVAEFNTCLLGATPAVRTLLRDTARAHRQQTEWALGRLAKDAPARCAEWLLSQAHSSAQGDWTVQLQQRKRAIAAQLGIAPETLSRVLRNLREQRLISGTGRVVVLADPDGLRRLAGASAPLQETGAA